MEGPKAEDRRPGEKPFTTLSMQLESHSVAMVD